MNERQVIWTVPEIETERLVLKEIFHNDAHGVYQIFTDERVVKTFGYRMDPSLFEAHNVITFWRNLLESGEGIRWGLYLKPSMKLIGNVGFKNLEGRGYVNVGYALMPYYWGRGLMTEALSSLITYAFAAMDIHKVEASVFTDNKSSIRLLEKVGFVQIAHKPRTYFFDNDFHDVYQYIIEKESLRFSL